MKQHKIGLYGVGLFLFSLLVLLNAFRLPLGEAPDESDHLAVALFIAEAGHPPLTDEERAAAGVKGGLAPFYYQVIAQIIRPIDLSSLPALRQVSAKPERYIPEDGLGVGRILHTIQELPPYHGIVLAWHLARLVSLVFALGTLIVTYLWALALFNQTDLAVGITLFVAFLPRFIINSAVVNDDNLATFLIVLFLYLLVKIIQSPLRTSLYFSIGIVWGFAVLTKYYSLILGLDLLLLFIYLGFKADLSRQKVWQNFLKLASGFIMIAGPWLGFITYRFNLIDDLGLLPGLAAVLGEPQITNGLYGLLNGAPVRPVGASYPFLAWMSLLFKSFWLEYGWMTLFAEPIFYVIPVLFSLLSFVGWGIYFKNKGYRLSAKSFVYVLSVFHFGLFLLILLGRYMLSPTIDTGQGRHLFPALPVIGGIFIFGLGQLFRRVSFHYIGLGFILFGMISSLFFLEVVVRPAYTYLPITTQDSGQFQIDYTLEQTVDKGLNLWGYNLGPSPKAGTPYPVLLYWQPEQELETDYWLKVCLTNHQDEPVSCWQGYAGGGRYPSRSWEVGDVIADTVYIPLVSCLSAGEYRLTLEVARLNSAERTIKLPLTPVFITQLAQPVTLSQSHDQSQPESTAWWYRDKLLSKGQMLQLRDTLTAITYSQKEPQIELSHQHNQTVRWMPVSDPLTVHCPNNLRAWVTTFTVDYGLILGSYQVHGTDIEFPVMVRVRDFAIDHQFTESIDNKLNLYFAPVMQQVLYPGQTVSLTVIWQARQLLATPYIVSIRILDQNFGVIGKRDVTLGGRYPNILWAPGEVVPETYFVPLDRKAPPGLYRLELSLLEILDPSDFRFLPIFTSKGQVAEHLYPFTIRILDPAHAQFAPTHQTDFKVGRNITLTGFETEISSERKVSLALYWQTNVAIEGDYTVFTQLIGPDGQVWGQQDNQPQAGRYPTYVWQENDKVVDRFEIPLRPEAPPGIYRLLVGMYQLQTGERLQTLDGQGQPLPDNAIQLTTFTLTDYGLQ